MDDASATPATDTLVIFAHPALERARVGPAMAAAAQASPRVAFRDLYELYPDFTVDVQAEQAALTAHKHLVLQFPFYWYSAPALLKEWLDLVFTHGFAYGGKGKALKGKTMSCAISTGGGPFAYNPTGPNRYSIDDFLRPFDQTAHLCGMRWKKAFAIHGAAVLTPDELASESRRYAAWLDKL